MGNLTSLAMGLAAQEEEEAVSVVSDVEEGVGEEQQDEVMEVVSEEGGTGDEEKEGRGGEVDDEVEEQNEPELQCSICLDAVVAGGEERSTARLQCGHEFHLDCIGSAFNAKGFMQCPNCREIEMGNWRYASGPHSTHNVSSDDSVLDEDLDLAPPRVFVPLPLPSNPISRRLSQLPSMRMIGEIEPSSTAANLPGPSTASSSHAVDRNVDYHWNSLGRSSNGQSVQRVHLIDSNRNPWAPIHSYSSPNNSNGVAEQTGLPVGGIRIGGVDNGSQQQESLSPPPFYGNGSERHGFPSVPLLPPQLERAPAGNTNPQLEQGSSSLFAQYQPLYGGVRLFGSSGSGSSFVETTPDEGGNLLYAWEREYYTLSSPVNDEGDWASSSQQQPPHGAPEPAPAPTVLFGRWAADSASARPPPPPENDRSAPDDSSFQ